MGNSCFCILDVDQQDRALVERFGKYDHLKGAGLQCILWPIYSIAGKVCVQITELNLRVNTKTKDNVFVDINVAVQYKVQEDKVFEAFYELSNPRMQIEAYIYDVVRSTIPQMSLDETFVNKDEVSNNIKTSLKDVMEKYGFEIISSLVTDIDPDIRVKNAMNEINATKRMIQAARNKAEGDKVVMIKQAEADAQSKYLSGQGVARQRAAIVEGLRDSIHNFSETVNDTKPHDIMELLLLTQYFDMLKEIGVHKTSTAIFTTSSGGSSIRDEMMQAMSK